MSLNFGLTGKVYDPVEVTISGEDVEEYARASGDRNPRYGVGEGQIASPVFIVVPGLPLMEAVAVDPELNVENMLMLVHGEQEFIYHRALIPGTRVVLTPSLASVEDKGKGATYKVKVAATDVGGNPLVDMLATIFVRGGGSGEERPSSSASVVPEKGTVVATFDRHVAASMPTRYAKISGDHNPIHVDDDVAKQVGLPRAINHGLATLSLVAGGLVECLADGDPGRIRTLQTRFTGMVFPDSDISTTVWAAKDGAFLFESRRADGALAMSGSAGLIDA